MPSQERTLPWWRAPLPAWAQAAATVVIFGVGLSIGLARGNVAQPQVSSIQPVATSAPQTASRTELSQLEERLMAEMVQLRNASATTPVREAAGSDTEIMKKVEAMLAASEERQRREFTLRSVDMARDFETQRRIDLATVREAVGQFQGVTGNEIRQQREAIDRINNFIRVSQGR
jgi:primosomal protein N''